MIGLMVILLAILGIMGYIPQLRARLWLCGVMIVYGLFSEFWWLILIFLGKYLIGGI